MKAVPDQVAAVGPQPFVPLGTDGFGRSDTREALRRFFEVDMPHVVVATLWGLAQQGEIKAETVAEAIDQYGIDPERTDPRAFDPQRRTTLRLPLRGGGAARRCPTCHPEAVGAAPALTACDPPPTPRDEGVSYEAVDYVPSPAGVDRPHDAAPHAQRLRAHSQRRRRRRRGRRRARRRLVGAQSRTTPAGWPGGFAHYLSLGFVVVSLDYSHTDAATGPSLAGPRPGRRPGPCGGAPQRHRPRRRPGPAGAGRALRRRPPGGDAGRRRFPDPALPPALAAESGRPDGLLLFSGPYDLEHIDFSNLACCRPTRPSAPATRWRTCWAATTWPNRRSPPASTRSSRRRRWRRGTRRRSPGSRPPTSPPPTTTRSCPRSRASCTRPAVVPGRPGGPRAGDALHHHAGKRPRHPRDPPLGTVDQFLRRWQPSIPDDPAARAPPTSAPAVPPS